MQVRILEDGRRASTAKRLAAAEQYLHQEAVGLQSALRKGHVDEKDLTPVQLRIRDDIAQSGAQVEAFLQALADRDAEEDGQRLEAAVINLIGSMMGRVLALEAQIAALGVAVVGD